MNKPDTLLPYITALFIVLATFLFISLPAYAHKLNVFSWGGDKQIYGEAFFNGGRKAKNVTVRIEDAESHDLLLTIQTDKQGKFAITVPQEAVQQRLDLLVSVNSGDGHRGEWLLEADEYLLSAPPAESGAVTGTITEPISPETVREIARQEIQRELAERQQQKVRPQDILGGIGCIIGLAALFSWFQANKKKRVPTKDTT